MKKQYQTRDIGKGVGIERRCVELREFDSSTGKFSAYVAVWNDVDSFGTRFTKGAFTKTIQERVAKNNVKILWQHDTKEPIGIVTRATEDNHGLLIEGALDVGVERADQARTQMDSGTINQMSFGFDIVNHKRASDGFIDITEVKWWEASPVTFGANENTSIESVRSLVTKNEAGEYEWPDKEHAEKRATDFDETFDNNEMWSRGWKILQALEETMDSIWWGDNVDGIGNVSLVDIAFEKAHAAYLEWASEFTTRDGVPIKETNALTDAFENEYAGKTIEEIAVSCSLSADELTSLRAGKLVNIEVRNRLAEFSPAIMDAYQETRKVAVAALFSEIRDTSGFSDAEKARFTALLGAGEKRCSCGCDDAEDALAALDRLSETIGGKNE